MSRYAGAARERFVQLGTAAVAAAPVRADAPHITVSPRTASGLLTGNLALIVIPPAAGSATAGAGGFNLTLYRVSPTLGEWGALTTYVGVPYRDQLIIPDLSGGFGVYFVFANVAVAGNVLVGVAELP